MLSQMGGDGVVNIFVEGRDGKEREIPATVGVSLMEIIREAGIDDLLAICGGACSCATCHVYVDPAFYDSLPDMQDAESQLLDSSGHRRESSRLACQIPFSESLIGIRLKIASD
jgi:2Fe-2S ferredoxin